MGTAADTMTGLLITYLERRNEALANPVALPESID